MLLNRMKKILSIIVVSLLLSGNVYAESITLDKCRDVDDKEMDSNKEKYSWTYGHKSKSKSELLLII